MPIEPGWEVDENLQKQYKIIERFFEEKEAPILTTRMRRHRWFSKGLVVLTNLNLWWAFSISKLEVALFLIGDAASTIQGMGSIDIASDPIHGDYGFLKGTNRRRFSLYHIIRFINKGKGKYLIYWMKFNKDGTPKVNKKGEYKTYKEAYRIHPNEDELKSKYIERREKFGYFLQKAIESLPKE